jgi:hypothetical protein
MAAQTAWKPYKTCANDDRVGTLEGPALRRLTASYHRREECSHLRDHMMRENGVFKTAVDLKRSALAAAMVLLKELDEALPEKHGAREIIGALFNQPSRSSSESELEVVTDEHVNGLLLAITGTIGRLLAMADDKCPDGPLKPMLLFRIVEDLAREGYDVDSLLDFVRRAHAGALEPQESPPSGTLEVFKPAVPQRPAASRVAGIS